MSGLKSRRGLLVAASVLLVVLALSVTAAVFTVRRQDGQAVKIDNAGSYQVVQTRIGSLDYRLQVAASPQQQELGLGGRSELRNGTGMLFPYAEPRQLCFWMKDMQLPIDMLWLDDQQRLVKLEPNVQPDTYPKTFCSDNAQYVVEIPAGQAAASGVRAGDEVRVR